MGKKKRKERIDQFLKEIEEELKVPRKARPELVSREYRKFKEEEAEGLSLYERFCKYAERIIKIEPSGDRRKKLEHAIDFTGLSITPEGAYSFSFLAGIAIISIAFVAGLIGIVSLPFVLIALAAGVILIYALSVYPNSLFKRFKLKASSEMVLAILYMAIYLRSSPNMEGALKFACVNLRGPLGYHFRKLLWDVEIGKYGTAEKAIRDYLKKWGEREEFVESVNLLIDSLSQMTSKRIGMIDESVDLILNGTRERMSHYAEGLRMPILLIFSLGIMLPVMGLILLPVVAMFMPEVIRSEFIFIGYDVLLPIILFFFITKTLEKRPQTISQPDVSMHPEAPEPGNFSIGIGSKSLGIPSWILSLFSIALIAPGIYMIFTIPVNTNTVFLRVLYSLLIIGGGAFATSVYLVGQSIQRKRLRDEIYTVEHELGGMLYKIGHEMSLGKPIEEAIYRVKKKSSGLKISKMLSKVLSNIRSLGMSTMEAIFNKKHGAIWHFPSKTISSCFRIIFKGAVKGTRSAANAALKISSYLKKLHSVEEELTKILSETLSSMRFLALFLLPLVGGITVTMTVIMMQILIVFKQKLASLSLGHAAGLGFGGFLMKSFGESTLSAAGLQVAIGIFVIEGILLLSYFSSRVQWGEEEILTNYSMGTTLLIGVAVYILIIFVTYFSFVDPISSLLRGGLVKGLGGMGG